MHSGRPVFDIIADQEPLSLAQKQQLPRRWYDDEKDDDGCFADFDRVVSPTILGGSIKAAKSLNGMVYFFGSLLALAAVSIEDWDIDCSSKYNWLKLSSRRYSAISYGLLTTNECRRDLRYPWIGFARLGVMPSLVGPLIALPDSLRSAGTEMVEPMKYIILLW